MAAAACCTAGGSYDPPLYWALTVLEATARAESTIVVNLVIVKVVTVRRRGASLLATQTGRGHA